MKTAAPLDISELLNSEEKISAYLSAVIEDNDLELLIQAIGYVAKAYGISQISKDTGLGRESLYKTFSAKTYPRFDTVIRVLNAMNLSFQITPNDQHNHIEKKTARATKRIAPKNLVTA